jgi:hypothetical protein
MGISLSETTAERTRRLLAGGVIAGPLFVVVAFIQAFTRPGFDLARHPLSLLSLGDLGWIQIANFVATGVVALVLSVWPNFTMNFVPLWIAVVPGFGWASAIAARLMAESSV